jgi:hypothetical protein
VCEQYNRFNSEKNLFLVVDVFAHSTETVRAVVDAFEKDMNDFDIGLEYVFHIMDKPLFDELLKIGSRILKILVFCEEHKKQIHRMNQKRTPNWWNKFFPKSQLCK